MPDASGLTTGLFTGLVAVVAVVVGVAIVRAKLGPTAWIGLLVVYLGLPGFLAWRGALDRYDPLPAPALLLLLGLSVLSIGLSFTRVAARLGQSLPVGAILAFQAFRIGVEWLLHRLYLEGVVPVQMTYSGRNFDVISGLTGLALGAWMLSGRPARREVVLVVNFLGLALLANIVGVAALSTPTAFRAFPDGPANLVPSTFPFVWLPSFLVQVALASHLLVFRQLRSTGRAE